MNNLTFKTIEIAHLELKYGHSRIQDLNSVLRLAESIEAQGQLIPVLAVGAKHFGYVLIDGYLRVQALKRLGRDMIDAWIWHNKEADALIYVLAKAQGRNWDIYEQACLVKHLYVDHQVSQSRIAQLTGKNKSWVSRRLMFVENLPEDIIGLVRQRHISGWSAQRILAPLARANKQHAVVLADQLKKESLPTRQLALLFSHYKKAGKKVRENIVNQPHLFLKTLKIKEEEKEAEKIKASAEDRWLRDLQVLRAIMARLIKQVSELFDYRQTNLDRRLLLTAFNDTRQLMDKFVKTMEKEVR